MAVSVVTKYILSYKLSVRSRLLLYSINAIHVIIIMTAISFGITLQPKVYKKLEEVRGRIPRSTYISMLLEERLEL